jgi:hypothetical protein
MLHLAFTVKYAAKQLHQHQNGTALNSKGKAIAERLQNILLH